MIPTIRASDACLPPSEAQSSLSTQSTRPAPSGNSTASALQQADSFDGAAPVRHLPVLVPPVLELTPPSPQRIPPFEPQVPVLPPVRPELSREKPGLPPQPTTVESTATEGFKWKDAVASDQIG